MRLEPRLKWLLALCLAGLPWTAALSQQTARQQTPREVQVAIVIDDLGNLYAESMRVLELPGPVSVAILPYTPHSKTIARIAHNLGRDVLVHMPMQAHSNKSLGPGGLLASMDQQELSEKVRAALHAVPHAQGLNNHMGSLLTEQPKSMTWLMHTLKQEHKHFLDSRTTALTQAAHSAQAINLPHTSRDVFLDNVLSEKAIGQQFDLLIEKAHQNGTAVAIGHPNPLTLKVLEARLPGLKKRGVRLVNLSQVIRLQQQHHLASAKSEELVIGTIAQ
jgi:polysaccharide deacetylase 2 family uncharacterized protein YibQ